jgi:hypothetical protein
VAAIIPISPQLNSQPKKLKPTQVPAGNSQSVDSTSTRDTFVASRAQPGFAKAVSLALVAGLQLSSYAATIPEVKYQPVGDVRLLFNNNPEQITNEDLADQSLGGKSLYAEALTPGRYRNFFEHLNRTQQDLGYQVRLTNSGDETAEVVKTVGSRRIARL